MSTKAASALRRVVPPRSVNPLSLYFRAGRKILAVALFLIVGFYFAINRPFAEQFSLGASSFDVLEESASPSSSDDVSIQGSLEIHDFFPPQELTIQGPGGTKESYPFFQRARTLVPRFRVGGVIDAGWEAVFVLDPGTSREREQVVKRFSKQEFIKARFAQLKPGKHTLHIRLYDREKNLLKEITHPEIWILHRSIALLGDDLFHGSEETGSWGTLVQDLLSESHRKIFVRDLSQSHQTPLDFVKHHETDGRKPYLFSLDGRMEHETFLGIDEFWIGYFHTAAKRNLSPADYLHELRALYDLLIEKGITSDQIVIFPPTFSSAYDMKEIAEALTVLPDEWGVRLGPDFYTITRNEFGRMVSDQEPLLTPYGREQLAEKAATFLFEE